ncbi:hypothetical protein PRZ48_011242 [Zasmidium cellare]|uniref:Uncharacterized protein n=1 Tax=Zasmidium cellare TaxID=395010 RepID=A0ABR0EB57_ZASCE|nr:hypothetical protein PRZ48_011242 [Zasmidium cellare]
MSHQSSNSQPVEDHVMALPGIEGAVEEAAPDMGSNTQQRDEPQSVTSRASSLTRNQTPRHLDPKNPCFIFRLTAELRDIIYDELLLFEEADPNKILHTQILATCKEIHAEGLSRLQDQNFKTTLLARIWLRQDGGAMIRFGSGETEQVRQPTRLYNEVSSFPPTSSDLKRLVVVLTVHSGSDPGWTMNLSDHDGVAKVQFQLYLLVTQALLSTAVKDVYFKAQFNTRTAKARARRLLSHLCLPLRQLDSHMTLHLNDLTTRAGVYTSQLKVLLHSFCGNQQRPGGWEEDYARVEIDLTRSAKGAMSKLKDEPWKGLRERADARLTDEGS